MILREQDSVNLTMLAQLWLLRLQGLHDQRGQAQDGMGRRVVVARGRAHDQRALSTGTQAYLFLNVIPAKHISLLDPTPLTISFDADQYQSQTVFLQGLKNCICMKRYSWSSKIQFKGPSIRVNFKGGK